MGNQKSILIDTDIGDDVDDALAIALALRSPEIKIKAITTVFKNTAERARLAQALLDTFGETKIPVYEGSGRPIIHEVETEEIPCQCKVVDYLNYHKRPDHAADVIIQTLKEDPDTIIAAMGPLTNIALAILKAPEIMKEASIYLMGGAYGTAEAEWNVFCDPEAASVVFRSGAKLKVFPLDVTVGCRLEEKDLSKICRCQGKEAAFLMKLIEAWQQATGYGVTLHDVLVIAELASPDFVQYDPKKVVVELHGEFTRASTIAKESFFKTYEEPNAEVAVSVRNRDVVQFFLERVFSEDQKVSVSLK